jgi:polar amino acid transport system substrate-binding protein
MKQLVQNLRTGNMTLLQVPLPTLDEHSVQVQNYYSVISAGTEGSKVKTARASLLTKARQKPEQVKQVMDSIKTEGFASTYQKVMNKLDFPSPLGYSSAGLVIDIGKSVKSLRKGDLVACGGSTAVHAEFVSVPENLCAIIPNGVSPKHASLTTIATIAMQGIRQADLRLGESCVVIGLGLIGQLTTQLLKAGGIRVIGIDVNQDMISLATQSGAEISLLRSDSKLEPIILEATAGFGADAVIITAGTSSLDPVELAGRLARKKGKVVIVGAVPTGFSRPNYYQKELDLRMSSSYGPGRYDSGYEEKGLDYPIGYVRWTENRNMQSFLHLLKSNSLNIDILISHEFAFENSIQAYDLVVNRTEPFTGIVLQYDPNVKADTKVNYNSVQTTPGLINIGFIGAGSFAQKFLLPVASKRSNFIGVCTASPNNAANIASKYKFNFATTDVDQILNDSRIDTVFIATRHDSHAGYVLKALEADKHVFVEKPLAILPEDLDPIASLKSQKPHLHLMVGFNRRFAPLIIKARQLFNQATSISVNYRVNVGFIPPDHWTQDPQVGGGRILGELCHFIDLCMFLTGSKPLRVQAFNLESTIGLNDTVHVNLSFENGSVATVAYLANGNKKLPKEYLEIHGNGISAVIDDFKELTVFSDKTVKTKSGQDKGHKAEVDLFLDAVRKGGQTPIPFEEIYLSSLIPFKIIESFRKNSIIDIHGL